MVLPDTNLLLYAHMEQSKAHRKALEWWEGVVNSGASIGLTWVTILGFLRLSTKRTVFRPPLTVPQAEEHISAWFAQPNIRIVEAGHRHAAFLFELLREAGIAGDLTTDAHLAAMALEWNATIYSADADFGRWPRVKWVNPLAS